MWRYALKTHNLLKLCVCALSNAAHACAEVALISWDDLTQAELDELLTILALCHASVKKLSE